MDEKRLIEQFREICDSLKVLQVIPTYVKQAQAQTEVLIGIKETLDTIQKEMGRNPFSVRTTSEKDDFYISYPPEGDSKQVTKGDLVIDFWEGDVRLPNGKEDKISGDLNGSGFEAMESIFVMADQDVNVQLDERGFFLSPQNELQGFIYQPFRIATVRTTTTTKVKVVASTHPAGGILTTGAGSL